MLGPDGQSADFALYFEGDLEGCLYTYVNPESSGCTSGGTYHEFGNEVFVGTYNGEYGTFTTEDVFKAKYRDCPNFAGQISGGCRHP